MATGACPASPKGGALITSRARGPHWLVILLLAVGICALLFLWMTYSAKAPEWSATRAHDGVRFFHFNVCGGVCNEGATGELITAVTTTLVNFRPVVVSLNELCRDQYTSFREALREAHYPMEGRWIETMNTSRHCSDEREGLALLSRRDIAWTQAWRLPHPRADERTLLCIAIRLGRHVRVCGTHIAPHETDKGDQIDRVARLTQFDPRIPIVLMGDFNATPPREVLDPIYAGTHGDGAHGRFREVDDAEGDEWPCRCGEPTFEGLLGDPKIDYIFLTGRHWRSIQGDATPSPYSDHHFLRGSAVLKPMSSRPDAAGEPHHQSSPLSPS
jgi:endonuclease/exonuclease/phosphatase family metal-dependent hydrolase